MTVSSGWRFAMMNLKDLPEDTVLVGAADGTTKIISKEEWKHVLLSQNRLSVDGPIVMFRTNRVPNDLFGKPADGEQDIIDRIRNDSIDKVELGPKNIPRRRGEFVDNNNKDGVFGYFRRVLEKPFGPDNG